MVRLPENWIVRRILGGAARQRRDNGRISSAALADEISDSPGASRFFRHPMAPLALILLAMLLSTTALADSGAEIYKKKCAACHGQSGAGDTMIGKNQKIRSLRSSEVQKLSDDQLFNIIGKGGDKMPAYDRKLSKDQIRDLVRYIRALK
jgi:mono/diheme cytochrome c family protein